LRVLCAVLSPSARGLLNIPPPLEAVAPKPVPLPFVACPPVLSTVRRSSFGDLRTPQKPTPYRSDPPKDCATPVRSQYPDPGARPFFASCMSYPHPTPQKIALPPTILSPSTASFPHNPSYGAFLPYARPFPDAEGYARPDAGVRGGQAKQAITPFFFFANAPDLRTM